MTEARAIRDRQEAAGLAGRRLRLVRHPRREGQALLVKAGSASFAEIHDLVERQRETGLDLLVRAERIERVARLLNGPAV